MSMIAKKPNLIGRFSTIMNSDGLGLAVERTVRFMQAHMGLQSPSSRRRIVLSRRLHRKFGGEVRYGPLRGLKLRLEGTWGRGDRAGMLLGLYEKEVAEILAAALRERSVFIDIGAADGYYAVGFLKAGLCEHSIAFEMSAKARESIRASAELNGVSGQLSIFGAANGETLQRLQEQYSFAQSVVLCDIEGAEVALLDEHILQELSKAVIVIELHSSGTMSVEAVEALLRERAQSMFDVRTVYSGARSPLQIPEIASFDEDDQWLICSEGRGYRQSWLVLSPKSSL